MAGRQWQMRRLSTGDYLLPANSVERTDRFYRLRKWTDGPHLGAERTRIVWSLFVGAGCDMDHLALELAPWDMPEWRELGEYPTRSEAIAAAVQHDEQVPA